MGGVAEGAALPTWLPHIKASIPPAQHKQLMRFRLGCWPLAANRTCGTVARDMRVCKVCRTGMVEDELHVLMECPVYSEIRSAFNLLMDGSMRKLMLEGDQVQLAGLLSKIWSIRQNVLGSLNGDP